MVHDISFAISPFEIDTTSLADSPCQVITKFVSHRMRSAPDRFEEDEDVERDSLLLGDPSTNGQPSAPRNHLPGDDQSRNSLWNLNFLPPGPWKVGQAHLVLSTEGVKLFKFFSVTVLSLMSVHQYALFMNADRDESYTLQTMILFDGNAIVLDIVMFFLVGRLFETDSVDSLGWIVVSIGSAIIQSILVSNSTALHHSITAYEIHCSWTWQFWMVIGIGILAIVGLVLAHFFHAAREGRGLAKMVELVTCLCIFIVPYASSTFFHLHHWYFAWILGMHANINVWWSRLTMCVLWGIYINGIAIYGRDPIMTCAVSFYQSQNQQCAYLGESNNLTLEELSATTSTDWHNCSVQEEP